MLRWSPLSIAWSELGRAPPFPPMRVLEVPEVYWSRALSLVCELALRICFMHNLVDSNSKTTLSQRRWSECRRTQSVAIEHRTIWVRASERSVDCSIIMKQVWKIGSLLTAAVAIWVSLLFTSRDLPPSLNLIVPFVSLPLPYQPPFDMSSVIRVWHFAFFFAFDGMVEGHSLVTLNVVAS